jgi:hypothetical protein
LDIFLIKNCNLAIPRPPYRTHKLQEKPSALKKEHPALQNIKILYLFYICRSFLPFWIRIRIQNLKFMRIHADSDPDPDPDPKPWKNGGHKQIRPAFWKPGNTD